MLCIFFCAVRCCLSFREGRLSHLLRQFASQHITLPLLLPLNGVISTSGETGRTVKFLLPPPMAPSWADVVGKGVHQPPPTPGSPSSTPFSRILAVYRACVAEGLWVQVQLESREGEEEISLCCRSSPTAAPSSRIAPTYRRRVRKRPDNERRREKRNTEKRREHKGRADNTREEKNIE